MPNKMRKCKGCGEYAVVADSRVLSTGVFHNDNCVILFWKKLRDRKERKAIAAAKKKMIEFKQETKRRKKELDSRGKWYGKLQFLVNQWITKVRDKDDPCITCGKHVTEYHAGHFIPVGTGKNWPIRFELSNIHKQCAYCNQFKGGDSAVYEAVMIVKYGQDHVDWLKGMHPDLKEIYPHWSDIELEIKRYRKLLRAEGLTPVK